MTLIKAVNLAKAYGEQVLFTEANFLINQGERIGLVGRNGYGKTTLLRLLTGEEEPDQGTITFPKHYTVGHLEQQLSFTRPTLLAEACLGLSAAQQGESWRVEKILLGLGFVKADFQRPPAEFSGGFQVRLNLAKVLASEPNLLLLDEPSNYLDITSIRWLVRFLQAWKNELILITHDRNLMDQVITHTLGIHRQKLRKLAGGTEKFYAQLAQEEEIYEKTRINEEKKRKEIETFINRFRYKATLSTRVQSRVKMLEKQERLEKLTKAEELEFSFPEAPIPGKLIMEAKKLSFSYQPSGPLLIDDLSFTVRKNDRIGIIGKNGKGKSTLLRLLAGDLMPVSGELRHHPGLQTAYFGQTNVERLQPDHTILEELMAVSPTCTTELARKISGAFMFSGDLALKKISVLSGGEKSRVLMSKLLLTPSNLLLLDEPTNHLDMEACDSLVEALDAYNGALILVTHNEMYLQALVNKLIVFDRDRVFLFNGNYQRFLEEIGWETDQEREAAKAEELASTPSNHRKALRQERADIITRRSLVLRPLEARINQLETAISLLEAQLQQNNGELITASAAGDGDAIARLAKDNAAINEEVEQLYTELATVTDEYEQASAAFEAEMENLDAG
ncbi:MAG TPA: ABC transporter ATP-binding protein [Firmicutes bacterium]|jgi:ATP-binding cassette subfamily F protein 3|nr:ABC transporter ATP-binding protein [Bacillota bacterium]